MDNHIFRNMGDEGGGGKVLNYVFVLGVFSSFWYFFFSPVEIFLALFVSTRPNGLNRSAVRGHTCLYIGDHIFLED